MTSAEPLPAEQHNIEIHRNREAWSRKPMLRQVYRGFYECIAAQLTRDVPGLTVELGSGMGNIKEVVPECITTDIFPNPWLDRQENAYRLSFADRSLANLILFDVWHHLEFPGTALAEFERVLAPGGRLILFEPGMGLIGRLTYALGHHEPVAMNQPIEWFAPSGFSADDAPYFAAQSRAHRIFARGEGRDRLRAWNVLAVSPFSSVAYLLSGGFSKPQLCSERALPLLDSVDRLWSRLPSLFAVRLLVVLEKRS